MVSHALRVTIKHPSSCPFCKGSKRKTPHFKTEVFITRIDLQDSGNSHRLRRLDARTMIQNPRQYKDDQHGRTTIARRDRIAIASPLKKLQTTGFETPNGRRISDATIEDNISPRTAVSAKFQRLGLRNSLSPTRRSTRRPSWTIYQEQEVEMTAPTSSQRPFDGAIVINETPEPATSSLAISDTNQDEEPDATQHDSEHAIFEFKAGAASNGTSYPVPEHQSFSKCTRFAASDGPATPSSSKRRRQNSTSPSASPTPIPRSQSPSARKLPSHKKRISERSKDSELDTAEAELSQFWWQPAEITGHDPTDPEEDNRGVNGIGYQRTKQETWKLGQLRKKQIAEWRSREAKEARALRAGGRKTLMGRVSKSSSRSGSPVETRRASPLPKGAGKVEGSPSKAVRFEVG